MTSIAAVVLLTGSLTAPTPQLTTAKPAALPAYGIANNDTWTFKVYAKTDVQPYSTGGTLTIKFSERTPGKTWRMELTHATEMTAGNETAKGETMTAWYEAGTTLYPTGTGEGSLPFGPQLLACLILPATAEERIVLFGRDLWTSTVATKDDTTTVTTNIEEATGGKHKVTRVLDSKTRRLLSAKCETRNALGLTVYELRPAK
jgi:hypothetical protein